MTNAMAAFNWIAGVLLMGTTIYLYPDHSAPALAHWALLYLAAIALPAWWYRTGRRHYVAAGIQETKALHLIAFRPLIVGVITLLAALPLIYGGR